MAADRLFVIDGHTLCYRAFYAIRELTATNGQATNAVYGFVNTLRKILRDFKPEYMAVCFDSKEKTHRQEKFSEYKIQRPPMPDPLRSQIPIIKEVVKAYNLPIFECGGFEADDIIAAISRKFSNKDLEVVIVSEDKDLYQLIDKNVKFFSARKDALLDYKEIKDLLGFEPSKIVDFIALAGDQSDNIPGVIGIGEVTAKNLINEFGSLEDILNNPEKIKSAKTREKIEEQRDSVDLSKELATLETDVPLSFDLSKMQVKSPDNNRLFELFQDLEFRKWVAELSPEGAQSSDVKARFLKNKKDIESLIAKIKKKGEFAFLIESSGEEEMFDSSRLAVSLGGNEAFDIQADGIAAFKGVFSDEKIVKVTHDIKSALKSLAKDDSVFNGEVFDVMLAGYLLNPAQGSFDVGDIAWVHLKKTVSGETKLPQQAGIVYQLYSFMQKELEEKSLLKLFKEIEIPLARVLFDMEKEGVNLDQDFLKKLSKSCDAKIKDLTTKLYKEAKEEFNLNSPKQLSKILFEKLKLPVIKKTKTGFSTDEGVLRKLAEKHEFPALILEYRQLAKLKSTYIDALPKLINPETGRIHTQFLQTGTETGRLSSRRPNLQNIPIRTELGIQIRKAIVPSDKNRVLVAADYSQIELRILAHLSADENLIKAFKEGEDIHDFTASLIFDVKQKDVTREMRYSAKRVNFGIVYGMSAYGLSKDLKISPAEAQDFIDKYFLRYQGVQKFMDSQIKQCEEKGFVLTLLNRRRYIPEIESPNVSIRQFAQRQAINTPVQGSAADLIKLAMINVHDQMNKRKFKSKMIITVHDELVFDALKDEKDDLACMVKDIMEKALKLSVPVEVSVKAGENWMEMEKL